ncbi:MAG: hypothetical protein J6X18_00175 [Bacteroidales bacterium]|nr:hypothetical protein [Bacteroidales bacterium]
MKNKSVETFWKANHITIHIVIKTSPEQENGVKKRNFDQLYGTGDVWGMMKATKTNNSTTK